MTLFFLKIYDWLERRIWLCTLLLLSLCGLCVAAALGVGYEEDIAKFLPQDDKSAQYSQVYSQVAGQDKVLALFAPADTAKGVPTDSIINAIDAFAREFESLNSGGKVKADVQQQIDEQQMLDLMQFVIDNAPYFLTSVDYARLDSLLATPGFVEKQLEEDKKQLMLPGGAAAQDQMRADPLRLFTPLLAKLQSFKVSDQFTVVDGYIFHEPSGTGMLTLSFSGSGSESARNEALVKMLDTAASRVSKAHPSVRVSSIGAPVIAVTNARQLKTDSLLAMAVALTIIVALLLWHYRRATELLWIVASITFGMLFAMAGMWLFKDRVSIIVLGIGSIMTGIAVNYPLHYLDHLLDEPDRRRALGEMVPPLLIGNITTVSAFLCLVWLDAEAMRDLGLFGSLVLAGTIVFVLVFLPHYVRARQKARVNQFNMAIEAIRLRNARQQRWFLLAVVALTLPLAWLSLDTSFDSNIQHINYMTPAQRADLKLLSSLAGNGSPVYATTSGSTLDEALSRNERLAASLDSLSTAGLVEKYSGAGAFVPSQAEQRKRLERWNDFWSSRRGQVLSELRQAAAKQGFSNEAFEPFAAMLAEENREVQTLDYFEPVTSMLRSSHIIKEPDGGVRLVNYVNVSSGASEEAVKDALRRHSDAVVFSSSDVGNQLVEVLSSSFNYIGLVCGVVVFFFLWVSFGSLELTIISFLPLAVSWLWILGAMRLFGVEFNIVNVILATFIFGQGDDYSIFITEGLVHEHAYGEKRVAKYSSSVLLSAIIMFVGIGSLVLAKHPALRSLAWVTVIGMFTVVLMTYYLPPLLFGWLTTSGGRRRATPLTLYRLACSIGGGLFFVFMTWMVLKPWSWLLFKLRGDSESASDAFHRRLHSVARFVVAHTPGVKVRVNNPLGEDFKKPAMIICNHQSHLDIITLMSLTPKMVFVTNNWVWNNTFYGSMIRRAEFIPADDGHEDALKHVEALAKRGYSVVIFPEGTRAADCKVHRFHKGAFLIAQKLGLDVLPSVMHGAGHVLNKNEFMLRQGTITLDILPRVAASDALLAGASLLEVSKTFRKLIAEAYEQVRRREENTAYWTPFVTAQYRYKGVGTALRCRRNLRNAARYSAVVDNPANDALRNVAISPCGQGEMALLFALVHPGCQVWVVATVHEEAMLINNMAGKPDNLHVVENDLELPAGIEKTFNPRAL